MSRPKRQSPILKKAQGRCDALCTIDASLDLGKSLTVPAYKTKIEATDAQLKQYNNLLAQTDAAGAVLETLETQLADLTERMLKGVATHFGRESAEYAKAGGTRKSAIQYSARKSTAKNKIVAA